MTDCDKYRNLLEETMTNKINIIHNIHRLESKKINGKTVFSYIAGIGLVTTASLVFLTPLSLSFALMVPVVYGVTVPAYKSVRHYCKLKEYKAKLSMIEEKENKIRDSLNTMPKLEDLDMDKKEDTIEPKEIRRLGFDMPMLQIPEFMEKREEKPFQYIKKKQ